jgi:HNH endonuclease
VIDEVGRSLAPTVAPVVFGYCWCGCNGRTSIAKQTSRRRGHIKGQPTRYLPGHSARVPYFPLTERFWAQVDKTTTPNGCWLWTGYRDKKTGYGYISVNSRNRLAHHVALELAGRVVPDGLQVNHLCDNPPCVRLDHLVFGTSQDDADDRVLGGRQARGERQGLAKLRQQDVDEIRLLYATGGISQRALARKFGVSQRAIWAIVHGETWKQ